MAFLLVLVMLPLGLIGIGHWLLVDDPLEPAKAVVVFGGHVPFRAMEAADIFRKGLATEVWLTQGALHAEENEMIKLGVHVIPEHEYSRQGSKSMVAKQQRFALRNKRTCWIIKRLGRISAAATRVIGLIFLL
jgi:hypothetical protein